MSLSDSSGISTTEKHTVAEKRDELFSKKQEVTDQIIQASGKFTVILGLCINGSLTSCHIGI